MKRFALFMTCLLAFSTGFAGDADPYINQVLTKLEKPFSVKMNLASGIASQNMEVTVNGQVSYKDEQHSNVDLNIAMSTAGQGNMEMRLNVVDDGTHFWALMSMPAMNVNQVIKAKSGDSKNVSQMPGMDQLSNLNPLQLTKMAKENLQFKLKEKRDGKVILEAELTSEFANKTNMASYGVTEGQVQWVLDEKNTFPIELKLISDQAKFDAKLSDYTLLKDDSVFQFKVPEGATVMDMTANNQ